MSSRNQSADWLWRSPGIRTHIFCGDCHGRTCALAMTQRYDSPFLKLKSVRDADTTILHYAFISPKRPSLKLPVI